MDVRFQIPQTSAFAMHTRHNFWRRPIIVVVRKIRATWNTKKSIGSPVDAVGRLSPSFQPPTAADEGVPPSLSSSCRPLFSIARSDFPFSHSPYRHEDVCFPSRCAARAGRRRLLPAAHGACRPPTGHDGGRGRHQGYHQGRCHRYGTHRIGALGSHYQGAWCHPRHCVEPDSFQGRSWYVSSTWPIRLPRLVLTSAPRKDAFRDVASHVRTPPSHPLLSLSPVYCSVLLTQPPSSSTFPG